MSGRFSSSLILILFIQCIALANATIKGVSPEDLKTLKYTSTEFTCRDGSKTIPFSQVNDNFCDCEDGSDEPATSACDKGVYYCENKGFVGKKIFTSQIGDGVCDCCDGSDESIAINIPSNNKCKDTCKEESQEAMKHLIQEFNEQKEGLRIKNEYITSATKELNEKKDRLTQIEAEIKLKQTEKAEEEKKKEEADQIEAQKRAEIEARKQAEAELLAQQKLEEEKNNPKPTETETEQVLVQDTEDVVVDNGETAPATSTTVPDSTETETETTEEEDSEEEEEEEDEEEEEEQENQPAQEEDPELVPLIEGIPTSISIPYHYIITIPTNYISKMIYSFFDLNVNYAKKSIKHQHKSTAVNKLKGRIGELQTEIEDLEKEMESIKSITSKDFGENQSYYPLNGVCVSVDSVEYTYEMCGFDKVTQKSKHGGSQTNLGRWEPTSDEVWKSSNYHVMKYTGGQKCWGGPDRSATISIFCGKENRLSDPAEPNKCEYTLKFFTPSACDDSHMKSLHSQLKGSGLVHDEL